MSAERIATARALCARYAHEAAAKLRAATVPSVAIVSDGTFQVRELAQGTEGLIVVSIEDAESGLFAYGPAKGELQKPPPEKYGHLVVFVEGRPGFFHVLVHGEPTRPGNGFAGSA